MHPLHLLQLLVTLKHILRTDLATGQSRHTGVSWTGQSDASWQNEPYRLLCLLKELVEVHSGKLHHNVLRQELTLVLQLDAHVAHDSLHLVP